MTKNWLSPLRIQTNVLVVMLTLDRKPYSSIPKEACYRIMRSLSYLAAAQPLSTRHGPTLSLTRENWHNLDQPRQIPVVDAKRQDIISFLN